MPTSTDADRASALRTTIRTELDELTTRIEQSSLPTTSRRMPEDARRVILAQARGEITAAEREGSPSVIAWRADQAADRLAIEPFAATWVDLGDLIAELIELDPTKETLDVARAWATALPAVSGPMPSDRAIAAVSFLLELHGWDALVRPAASPQD